VKKERADKVLAARNLAPSCEKAQALIMAGRVYSAGARVEKPGQLIGPEADLSVAAPPRYVGRGGMKLEEALEAFAIPVEGKIAADLGSSTGGFTDCLLKRGARKVYAVDVDVKQIDCRLRGDPRVVLLEKNARNLNKTDFPDPPDIVTMDLSFISVLKVLPAVREFLAGGDLITLLKPQFEAAKGLVGKKGVIRDPAAHREILENVLVSGQSLGFFARSLIKCSTRGQKGNREFFVHWRLGGEANRSAELAALVKERVDEENH